MRDDLEKVVVTDAALALLTQLRSEHGEIVFQMSAGCCDGSGPMCYRANEAFVGDGDTKLGEVDGAEIWAHPSIAGLWENSQLVLDAAKGSGNGFSLDNGRTMHFVTRARLISADPQET